MADSSESPDWFMNYLLLWFHTAVVANTMVYLSWIFGNINLLPLFGVNDLYAGFYRDLAKDLYPPLAQEKMTYMEEFGGDTKPYWA